MTTTILIGIPASGKSTYADEQIKTNPKTVRVSRDDFRYMWKGVGMCDNKIEKLVTNQVIEHIKMFVGRRYNVIYDATNVSAKYINALISEIEEFCDIEFKIFDTDVETCKLRDSQRVRSVGNDVIDKMYAGFVNLINSDFDFSPRKRKAKSYITEFDPNKENCYVFDIDGTLAHYTNRSPFDWKRVGEDTPDLHVCTTLKLLANHAKIIIVSGRDEICRNETLQWLLKHLGFLPNLLFMRPNGNIQSDNIIKRDIYTEYIIPNYNILGVFDDRNQVVKELRDMGIKVFQVEEGNF